MNSEKNTKNTHAVPPATEADIPKKKFYLDLAHQCCTPPDNIESEVAWLWELHTLIHRTVKFLTQLNESTVSGITLLHNRKCSNFLLRDCRPIPERKQIAQTIASWAELSVKLVNMRDQTLQLEEEYTLRLKEIRKLLYECSKE